MLLGLVREGEGVAAQVLNDLGADMARVRTQVIQMMSGQAGKEAGASSTRRLVRRATPRRAGGSAVLDQFGRNLTQFAREGKLDPLVGREKEVERVMQVLSRRTKNNPVLIGEPGVGKTAIVEGLAQRIVANQVPVTLADKQLYTLDLGALVAGIALPRRLRGAPEEGPEGDPHARGHHLVHRRDPHAGGRRRRRGRHRRRVDPQAHARARRTPDRRAPRPSTSTASTSKRTPPSSAASSR